MLASGTALVAVEESATYRDLEDKLVALVVCLEGVQNWGELGRVEFHYGKNQRPVLGTEEALVELGDVVD